MENNGLNTNEFGQDGMMGEMNQYQIPQQENVYMSDVKEKGNVLMGAIGALVGSLIGVAI